MIIIISFIALVSQSVAETWQKGLQVLSQVSYDVDSTPCETLLLKAASFVYENLTKGDTLETVSYTHLTLPTNREV